MYTRDKIIREPDIKPCITVAQQKYDKLRAAHNGSVYEELVERLKNELFKGNDDSRDAYDTGNTLSEEEQYEKFRTNYAYLPEYARDRLSYQDYDRHVNTLYDDVMGYERKLSRQAVGVMGTGLIVGTVVEDVGTGGAGFWNTPACIAVGLVFLYYAFGITDDIVTSPEVPTDEELEDIKREVKSIIKKLTKVRDLPFDLDKDGRIWVSHYTSMDTALKIMSSPNPTLVAGNGESFIYVMLEPSTLTQAKNAGANNQINAKIVFKADIRYELSRDEGQGINGVGGEPGALRFNSRAVQLKGRQAFILPVKETTLLDKIKNKIGLK